jgi:hypothetical protein
MELRLMDNNLKSMCETVAEQLIVLGRVALKTCNKCGRELPLTEFNKGRKNPDGLDYRCKECDAKQHKANQKKNRARGVIVIPGTKTCPGCKIEKPSLLFNKNESRKDGLGIHCKECASIRNRKLLYGASPEWIKATLEAQGGACIICKFIPGPGDQRLHLDHKHGFGPRGFLHSNCNRGLGYFKDSVEIIGKGIEYLNGPTTGIVYKVKLAKHIKDKILSSQGYLCRICSTDLHNKKACMDHDHLTNMIRGALCNNCNCGLGCFKDSVELLTNAIGYLQKYEEYNQQQSCIYEYSFSY